MKLLVIINEKVVYSEVVSVFEWERLAALLYDRYQIGLLQECGVKAGIAAEVGSVMNSPVFDPKPEYYDVEYFPE